MLLLSGIIVRKIDLFNSRSAYLTAVVQPDDEANIYYSKNIRKNDCYHRGLHREQRADSGERLFLKMRVIAPAVSGVTRLGGGSPASGICVWDLSILSSPPYR